MKKLLMVLTILAGTCLAAFAQIVGPTARFAWDFPQADFTASQVVRFEVKVDGGAWVNAGVTQADDAATPAGSHTYTFPVGAQTWGAHTWTVRACNAQVCGPEVVPPADFIFTIVPGRASGLRITVS